MEVSRIRALRGPNLWTRHTAIEAMVRCEGNELDLSLQPEFEARLRHLFPGMGGLQLGHQQTHLTMAHALETATLHLQIQAGCPVTFSRSTATPDHGLFQVVVEYTEEEVGCLALKLAQQLCLAAAQNQSFDLDAAISELRNLDEDIRLGPSTGSIVNAAVVRGIPYRRLTAGSLVQLGWGSKQRRIQAAEIDSTSAIAESIAQDKELTKKLLHAAGVPVPLGRPVRDAEDAWVAALEVGLPVVVKPRDGNQGKGVTVNITTQEGVMKAFETAASFRDDIMVERFLPGSDYRLLVVGNKLVAAARREPPLVVGNGKNTVRELVEQVNADPRRGEGHATSLTKIRFDDIALERLKEQGLNAESVPAKGTRVILRNNANLSTGGTATDVTDDVHTEVAARAVAAAQMVGLDICGVDVVCESVLRPMEEQSGRGRSQCGARPADALEPLVWQRPRCGRSRDCHHVPRWRRWPHSRHCRHRHQRQNHHGATDLSPLACQRPARGHDQHRWRVCQWPSNGQRRLQRPAQCAQCVDASRRRCRGARNRTRRHVARRLGL